jgi:phage-related protein
MLEEPTTCKSGSPTQDGSRSSNTLVNNSLTSKMEKHLMFQEQKILKGKLLSFTDLTTRSIKDGELSILISQKRNQLKDLTKTSDSISIDHSTLSQDFQ